jgi:hypothetical protein
MTLYGYEYVGKLITEGHSDLTGTFVLQEQQGQNRSLDHPSFDGKFNSSDAAGIARVLASGNISMLEADTGNTYIIKILDSSGFFHVVAQ